MVKLTRVLFAVCLLTAVTVFFSQLLAQSNTPSIDPDEMYSSAVYNAVKAAEGGAAVAVPDQVQSGASGKPKLNVGPNVVMNAPFDPTPGADYRARSETSIASDPSGQFLVAGWNDAQGFRFAPFGPPPALGISGYAYSADGGKTWTDPGAPFVFGSPGVVVRGDPWLDTGGPGQKTFYYANLAVREDGSLPDGISVHSGSFTGNTFAFTNATFIPIPNPTDFLDKESLAAGKGGKTRDMVAVATTNFRPGGTTIDVFVSNDRAVTFPTYTAAQPQDGNFHQGVATAIGNDGTIYLTWEVNRGFPFFGPGYPQIVAAQSSDGGATFSARTVVSPISSGALFPPGGYNRQTHNDFPRIAVANAGKYKGRVYVVYNDSRVANGGPQPAPVGPEDIGIDIGHWDLDVYLSYSDDKGGTWSSPTLVAGGGDGKIQFWPSVSTDANGRVSITYYESVETTVPDFIDLDGLGTSLVDVFYSVSNDGGATFGTPQKVTDVTTDWGATPTNIFPNFGDYITHVSTPNHLHVSWADGRSGVMPEAFYASVSVGKSAEAAEGPNEDVLIRPEVITDYQVAQNYPNPFNPSTEIRFALPQEGYVSLKVYNTLGEEVATLVDGHRSQGIHTATFDARGFPTGIYFYRITAGTFTETRKMMLVK